jgi:hypothetical protein
LFRFLRFDLLSLYPLSWTFDRLPVPLLFRHRARNPALGAEAIEPLSLVSSLSCKPRTSVRSLARRKPGVQIPSPPPHNSLVTGLAGHFRRAGVVPEPLAGQQTGSNRERNGQPLLDRAPDAQVYLR